MKFHHRTTSITRSFVSAALLSTICSVMVTSPSFARAADDPAKALPTTAEKAAVPPQVGDIAPDFELRELSGETVKFSALAAKGPVVLVMLRGYPGYQCPFCTAQVGGLINKANSLNDAKASVLLVYPGPAESLKEHADEFVKGKDIPANFHLALDPDFAFTNLYALRWKGEGETSYPATFVVDTKRTVLFAKVSHSHGGRPTTEEVLAALPKTP